MSYEVTRTSDGWTIAFTKQDEENAVVKMVLLAVIESARAGTVTAVGHRSHVAGALDAGYEHFQKKYGVGMRKARKMLRDAVAKMYREEHNRKQAFIDEALKRVPGVIVAPQYRKGVH